MHSAIIRQENKFIRPHKQISCLASTHFNIPMQRVSCVFLFCMFFYFATMASRSCNMQEAGYENGSDAVVMHPSGYKVSRRLQSANHHFQYYYEQNVVLRDFTLNLKGFFIINNTSMSGNFLMSGGDAKQIFFFCGISSDFFTKMTK